MLTLPFTPEQFFEVFARYNTSVWPGQVALVALSLVMVALAKTTGLGASRAVHLGLAALWAWMAIVYHWGFFRAINPAATAFGALFLVESALLTALAIGPGTAGYGRSRDARTWCGSALLIYALVLYPLIGALSGHWYPQAPTFGLPCPTTIFTLGLLLWRVGRLPRSAVLVPLLWAAVGTSAALQLNVPEDFGLPAAALVTVYWLWRDRRPAAAPVPTPPGQVRPTCASAHGSRVSSDPRSARCPPLVLRRSTDDCSGGMLATFRHTPVRQPGCASKGVLKDV